MLLIFQWYIEIINDSFMTYSAQVHNIQNFDAFDEYNSCQVYYSKICFMLSKKIIGINDKVSLTNFIFLATCHT